MKKIAVVILAVFLGLTKLFAQEQLIYNQYHYNYYLVNPALAGAEPCSHFMLTNKMQWVGMKDFPMTQLASFKTRVWENIGIGAYLYHDRNGYSNRAGGQVTFAYHIPLSNGRQYSMKKSYDRQLSFGVSFKLNYFYISNQLFEDTNGDALTDDAFVNTNGWAPNMNFGIYYKDYGGFVGVSLTNLIPYKADIYGDKEIPAPLSGYVFGGYTFDLGSRKDKYLEPMAMVKFNQYGEFGMDINLKFGHEVEKDYWGYWVQASYRHSWNPNNIQSMQLMPMCGFNIGKFQIGYAFSLDLNNLVTQNYGTHEIMLGYTLCYQKHFCR